MIHFKPYLYLIQNYSTAETSIIMFVKHRRSMQSTTSICSFIRSHMIRVGAYLVLLIYRCFSAHYGFTRYMDFFADEYPLYFFLGDLSPCLPIKFLL